MDREIILILTRLVLAIAIIIAVWKWRSIWDSYLRWFPLYLIFCGVIEYIGYTADTPFVTIAYTVYDVITYLLFTYYFYEVLKKDRRVVLYGIMYIVILLISLMIEDIRAPLTIQSAAGTVLILLVTITYFISLIRSDEVLNFASLPSFWVASGLLVFNLGYLPITFSLNSSILPSEETLYGILAILAVVLYGSFIIALLCRKSE